jgi:hypothetical protein
MELISNVKFSLFGITYGKIAAIFVKFSMKNVVAGSLHFKVKKVSNT